MLECVLQAQCPRPKAAHLPNERQPHGHFRLLGVLSAQQLIQLPRLPLQHRIVAFGVTVRCSCQCAEASHKHVQVQMHGASCCGLHSIGGQAGQGASESRVGHEGSVCELRASA